MRQSRLRLSENVCSGLSRFQRPIGSLLRGIPIRWGMEPMMASSFPTERRAQTPDEENVVPQKRSQESQRRCVQIGSSTSIVAATRHGYAVRREPRRLRQKRDLLARRSTRIDFRDARAHSVDKSCRQIERTSIPAVWTTSVRTSSPQVKFGA